MHEDRTFKKSKIADKLRIGKITLEYEKLILQDKIMKISEKTKSAVLHNKNRKAEIEYWRSVL